uniref:Secreted protein n=1 Tax=Steinernema glaseri TaxID=37863 RepID=A0A1I7YGL9_9BILA
MGSSPLSALLIPLELLLALLVYLWTQATHLWLWTRRKWRRYRSSSFSTASSTVSTRTVVLVRVDENSVRCPILRQDGPAAEMCTAASGKHRAGIVFARRFCLLSELWSVRNELSMMLRAVLLHGPAAENTFAEEIFGTDEIVFLRVEGKELILRGCKQERGH